MIKRDLGALSELNLPKLIAVTRLLKAVQDYVAITDIMLFLLKHNCSPLLHSSVLITLIRKYEVIFVYQNQLTELSTAILEKVTTSTCPYFTCLVQGCYQERAGLYARLSYRTDGSI